jgi:hypothetical protein
LAELVLWLLNRALAEAAAVYQLQSRQHAGLEGLPPPMLPNNTDLPVSFCALPVSFRLP